MAGIAKPTYPVKKEGNYKLIESYNITGNVNGLFDGTTPNAWNTNEVAYWNTAQAYVIVDFYEKVNLHRFYSWNNNNNQKLKILKYNGIDYVEDYTSYHKDTSTQTPQTWRQFTDTLPSGKYKFILDSSNTGFTGRVDGEWYVETAYESKTFILHNGEYRIFNEKIDASDAIYSDTLVPKIISNTSHGLAFSSPTIDNSWLAWRAFNFTSSAYWSDSASSKNGYIGYKFNAPTEIGVYSLGTYASTENMMTKWDFLGSNDTTNGVDGTWELIESREKLNWDKAKSVFKLPKKVLYTAYKFIWKDSKATNGVRIGQIDLQAITKEAIEKKPYSWSTIKTTIPTSTEFLDKGMDSLSPLFNRSIETLIPLPITNKSEILGVGEIGKVFSKTIDLKKYIDIRGIRTEVE